MLIAFLMEADFVIRSEGKNPTPQSLPGVSVLKPLCGAEEDLESFLQSFISQIYPGPVQIVFGVSNADDPACTVVERLKRIYPLADLILVIGGPHVGQNKKVANLANMYPSARHSLIVISDSDALAPPDTLQRAVSMLESDPTVGAVTCPFRSVPIGTNFAARLGSIIFDAWCLPSAIVAARLLRSDDCIGPLTLIRSSVLESGGGLISFLERIDDDHALGRLVTQVGLRVRMLPCLVAMAVHRKSFTDLFRHHVRWTRTVRYSAPVAYIFSIFEFSSPSLAGVLPVTPDR